jgi:hypothetical protein
MMKIASRNEFRNGTECEINDTRKPLGATRKLTKCPVCDWLQSSPHLCIATPLRDQNCELLSNGDQSVKILSTGKSSIARNISV